MTHTGLPVLTYHFLPTDEFLNGKVENIAILNHVKTN